MLRKKTSFSKLAVFVLLLISTPILQNSRAGITLDGDVNPATVTSDPWYVDTLIVGNANDGTVSIQDNSNVLVDNDVFLAFIEDVLGIVIVNGGNSQLATGSGNIFVGARGEGRFTVSGGAAAWTDETVIGGIKPDYETLAQYFEPSADLGGGTGTATVTGEASNWNGNSMMVGFSGDGTLEITEGGRVLDHLGMIGVITDTVGTATVSGSDSVWTNNTNLVVGAWGQGDLTISEGGRVTAPDVYIGGMPFDVIEEDYDPDYIPDGTGTVTVTDAGSTLAVTALESLYVGYYGDGTLDVENKAEVISELGVLGAGPDAVGTVTVDGDDSVWTASEIIVGAWGEGNLTISNGGEVTTETLWMGGFNVDEVDIDQDLLDNFGEADGVGNVTVTGGNSILNVTGDDTLIVGAVGTGNLTVSGGATVNSAESFIGGYLTFEDDGDDEIVTIHDGGTGTATITGPESTWENEILVVGTGGDGTLEVSAAGEVSNNLGVIGLGPDSIGRATVTGGDSTWTMTDAEDPFDFDLDGTLIVGAWGEGHLTVSTGGEVSAVDLYIGGTDPDELGTETTWDLEDPVPNGTGTVTVTGTDSSLQVTGSETLYVGYSGNGTLDVNEGGLLTSGSAGIGVLPDSTGTVTVDDDGSTWENTESLFVGGYGTGQLTISDKGHVDIHDILYVGGFDTEDFDVDTEPFESNPDGTGTVTVTGVGSLLESLGIGVGIDGTGTLNILEGAEAQAEAVIVGIGEEGNGLVTVDGEDSTLRIAVEEEGPDIPDTHGDGYVVVSNGGQVIVDGDGAVLSVADSVTVGSEGEGTLAISNGGTVMSDDAILGGTDPQFDTLAEYLDPEAGLGTGTGTVTVTGEGSNWQTFGMMVGFSGDATLNVNDGGQITSDEVWIGVLPDAIGTATISGSDSTWINNTNLVVGAWGEGDLTISDGGRVTAPDVYIGGTSFEVIEEDYDPALIPDGTGTVTVTGADSILDVTDTASLFVGYFGDGTLDVKNEGQVTSGLGVLGASPEAVGTVTVDGSDSTWSATELIVGAWGEGNLTISNGGEVTAETLWMGGLDVDEADLDPDMLADFGDVDGVGNVTVTGENSTLNVTGNDTLKVGAIGTGTLIVSDGATVNSVESFIGGYVTFEDDEETEIATIHDGGTGTATVTGGGSTWENEIIVVGAGGNGTLNVSAGGQVSNNLGVIGLGPDSIGTATVTGSESTWNTVDADSPEYDLDGTLIVGAWGEGHLTVADGSQVSAVDLYIGGTDPDELGTDTDWGLENPVPNGTGTVTVTGDNSVLRVLPVEENDHTTYVGYSGNGTLNILDGGEVETDAVIVGVLEDSTGLVTVDGIGSTLRINGVDAHNVDADGEGAVNISNGGQIIVNGTNGLLEVGDPDFSGTVTVGSVGDNSTLVVSNGGTVHSVDAILGGTNPEFDTLAEYFAPEANLGTGTGTVMVTGEGSNWQTFGMMVGFSGDATLNVNDGGWVSAGESWIGVLPDAVGSATVSGSGSTWNNFENLVVGAWGQGDLTISDGARVSAPDVYIGGTSFDVIEQDYNPALIPDGTGTVTVTGEGSTLAVTDVLSLFVGYFGDGTLNVKDEGQVAGGIAFLGVDSDAVGTMTISDGGTATFLETVIGGYDSFLEGAEGPDQETMAMYFDPSADLDDGTGTLTVTGEGSTFETIDLTVGFSGNGTLEILDSAEATAGSTWVGVMPSAVGTVEVDGLNSTWTNTSELAVGIWGEGDLTIRNGAQVNAGEVYIGGVSFDLLEGFYGTDYIPDGTGTVTVTGEGSSLRVTEPTTLYVGYFGEGTLDVNEGGYVTSDLGVIGAGPDAIGNATVDGTSSYWSGEDLIVGAWGEGNLAVSKGGLVTAQTVLIGGFNVDESNFDPDMLTTFGNPNGTGKITVTGTDPDFIPLRRMLLSGNATLNAYNELYVGYTGNGTLDVNESGYVSNGSGGIAVLPGSIGTSTVKDNNSIWNTNQNLFVGGYGTGTLTVSGGGEASIGHTLFIGGFDIESFDIDTGDVGHDPNGTGTVTVTGTGSALNVIPSEVNNHITTYVGYSGDGTLNVLEGGQVETDAVVVGELEDSTGLVTVDGTGSTLQITGVGDHDVEGEGDGEVIISNGGRVIVNNPNGLLHVGNNGDFDSGTLTVGSVGTGSMLTVSNGGVVNSFQGVIGGYDPHYNTVEDYLGSDAHLSTGTGTATITSEGSVWDMTHLEVGFSGDGTLSITNGGRVMDTSAFVGAAPDVNGTVEVTGPGSRWDNDDDLVVGAWGNGTLNIENGGIVTSNNAYLGGMHSDVIWTEFDPDYIPLGTGTATVDGPGSLWQSDHGMYVGTYGEGLLTISNGGQVTSGTFLIGGLVDSEINPNLAGFDPNGIVIVTGDGSRLETDFLIVGMNGTGTLNVLDEGRVNSLSAYIGVENGSFGTAQVNGHGSLWQIDGNLYVGGTPEGPGGTGILDVNDGGLVIVDNLYVWSTGTLSGNGQITADQTVNHGTIAPGNSIGTQTILGDLVFEPGSVYEVEVANDDTSDKIIVDGDATINGGTVKAIAMDTIVGSHEYQIIQANSVSGVGFDVLDTALVQSVADAGLDYDETSVWLYLTAMAFDDPNVWRTKNQKSVGQALQHIATEEGGNDNTAALQGLGDFDRVRGAYDQLCGQTRPTLGPITTSMTSNFIGTVSGGLRRGSVARSNYPGNRPLWAMAGSDPMTGMDVTTDVSPSGQAIAVGNGTGVMDDTPWGIWFKDYGLFGDRDSEDGVFGYRYKTYGFGLGIDYQFTENLLMGITSGFSGSQVDYYNSRNKTDSDALYLGLYGRWTSESWYTHALFTYAGMEYDTDRFVDLTGEHLKGDLDGYDLAGYVEAGLSWQNARGWEVNPLIAAQWSSLNLDSYTESGGPSALTFKSERFNSFKSALGARATKELSSPQDHGKTVWEVRGRWVHEFDDIQSSVDAAFITNPGVVFKVSDSDLPRDSAVFGTGLKTELFENTDLSLEYDIRLNSDDTAHLISVVLQHRW